MGTFRRVVDNGSEKITRVLFCGPHFAASHNYTKEYVQCYPFIQVVHFVPGFCCMNI